MRLHYLLENQYGCKEGTEAQHRVVNKMLEYGSFR